MTLQTGITLPNWEVLPHDSESVKFTYCLIWQGDTNFFCVCFVHILMIIFYVLDRETYWSGNRRADFGSERNFKLIRWPSPQIQAECF